MMWKKIGERLAEIAVVIAASSFVISIYTLMFVAR